MAENQLMERQNNESGEEEPGVYWVYWADANQPSGYSKVWRANFLDWDSYFRFVMSSRAITITDQGWYETL